MSTFLVFTVVTFWGNESAKAPNVQSRRSKVVLHLLWGEDRPAYRPLQPPAVAWKITGLSTPTVEVRKYYAERLVISAISTPAILAQPWYKQVNCLTEYTCPLYRVFDTSVFYHLCLCKNASSQATQENKSRVIAKYLELLSTAKELVLE